MCHEYPFSKLNGDFRSSKKYHSKSVTETQTFAKKILTLFDGHGVISLEGPLGAGKTHFVKGVAAALQIEEEVTSPTFTLLQSYGSPKNQLHHIDFYRLKNEEEALELGLEHCFEDNFTIIEWGDKFLNLLPHGTLRISLTPVANEEREISWYFHALN